MKYRLYVDEVGNPDLRASKDSNHRYLSLTGVIFELEYVATTVFPTIEQMKRDYFNSHPDEPVILHRKELVNKKHPFESLRDVGIEEEFNRSLLHLLQNLDYAVITIVLDKLEHSQRYEHWRFDPYHYCLTVIVERYILWLKRSEVVGDVMAESRSGNEDMRLKAAFEDVYMHGSDFMKPEMFAAYLTSKQLKIKPKSNNIAGLQLADLIAYPSFRAMLAHNENQPSPDNFGGKIGTILETSKYVRGPDGQIDSWGRGWLP
jgi:hypothetical protein